MVPPQGFQESVVVGDGAGTQESVVAGDGAGTQESVVAVDGAGTQESVVVGDGAGSLSTLHLQAVVGQDVQLTTYCMCSSKINVL